MVATPVENRIETLEDRVETVEVRMGSLENRMGSLENRMGTVEVRMGTLETEVRTLRDEIRNHFVTRADLEKAKWQLGALVIGSIGAATTIITLVGRIWV